MKNLVCFIFLLFITTHLVAQDSTMSQKQLEIALDQAIKRTNTGKLLTILGSIGLVSGGILSVTASNQDPINEFDKATTLAGIGFCVGLAGTVMVGVGIPMWIVGKNKQDKVLFYLAKFDDQSYIPSVGFQLHF